MRTSKVRFDVCVACCKAVGESVAVAVAVAVELQELPGSRKSKRCATSCGAGGEDAIANQSASLYVGAGNGSKQLRTF
jgi:hypothetical protein